MLLEVSSEAIESHNKVKSAVTAELLRIAREDDIGEVYGDGALLTHSGAGLSCEPDTMFASWATLETGRLLAVARHKRDDDPVELEGAPDLVVEVIRDSSVRKDQTVLRAAYARAGVREYWLVDARGEDLRFEILVLRNDGWVIADAADQPQRSEVLERTFTLVRERNRIGRFAYRLEHVR
ncbi:MAG: hypothetical protein NVS3B20_08830 [Polyangiales bacterium]